MNAAKPPLLSLHQVSVQVQDDNGLHTLLHDISFTMQRGETLALVGESGSGKSLCAQTIMGILPRPVLRQSGGSIHFDGERIDNHLATQQRLRGKRIAMIFQEPMAALNPVQTVGAQLAEVYALHFPQLAATEVQQRSVQMLERVGIAEAEQRLLTYPHQLSGGQCQRVMIAMALACEPDLLIADEPSTALDSSTQQQLLQLLQTLQREMQLAVLFITHDLALVAQWCQRVAVLQAGTLCELADTAQLFRAPQHPYTCALLAAISHATPKDSQLPQTTPLLEARGLYKQFSRPKRFLQTAPPPRQVLHDVSLAIHGGEIVALVGESGCGKSTLGRALLMLDPPDQGEVICRGNTLQRHDNKQLQALRREWQVIFQDSNESLNPRHTVGRILAEPFEIHGVGTRSEREARVRALLQQVELPPDSIHRFPHEFSGGQRQRIGIARAIALNPALIVCDEAVSALDVSTQAQIIELLLKLKAEMELSLLFITHDLNVVRRIADRVLVMQAGRIVESGNAAQVLLQPQHDATRQLLAAAPTLPQQTCEG